MKRPSKFAALLAGLALGACGAQPTGSIAPSAAPPAATTAATALPGPAAATAAPTPAAQSPAPTPGPRAVTFSAAGGATLAGKLYGGGATAVILSNMGDNDPRAWEAFAPTLAGSGYTVLTYKFRYPTNSSKFDSDMANHTLDDLRAAVAFAREQGAQSLVLVGASLGGMATAKAAALEKPAAMVIMASPADLSEFDFRVERAELQAIAAPKLFVGSADDGTVPLSATRQMYELASEPKELQVYPGTAHGVHLFDGEHADELRQRLIAFITANAPPS